MARSRSFCNPMSPEGCWVKFQLDLRNIKLEAVAKRAGVTVGQVSRVICGTRKTINVKNVLATMLGFSTYEDLMETARLQTKGGVA